MPLEDIFTKEQSEKFNVFKTFFETGKNLPFMTDLTLNQIKAVVMIEYIDNILDKRFGVKLGLKKGLSDPLKAHLVSKNRMGRAEMVEVLKEEEDETEERGKSKRLRNLLGIGR